MPVLPPASPGPSRSFVPQAAGRVAVYFKNYPLDNACNPRLPRSIHPGACNLALGAVCAHYQGKFEAFHDKVFSTELRNPQPADVVRLAGEAGLNAAALEGCLDDPKTKADLAAQIDEATRLGVDSTPTRLRQRQEAASHQRLRRGGGQGSPQEGLPAARPVVPEPGRGLPGPAASFPRPDPRLTAPRGAASLRCRGMKLDAWLRQEHPLPSGSASSSG